MGRIAKKKRVQHLLHPAPKTRIQVCYYAKGSDVVSWSWTTSSPPYSRVRRVRPHAFWVLIYPGLLIVVPGPRNQEPPGSHDAPRVSYPRQLSFFNADPVATL